MAGPLNLTGQNIQDTYRRVLQTDGVNMYDGTGSLFTLTSTSINTGSFATTGSNNFTGNQIVTGSFIISGSNGGIDTAGGYLNDSAGIASVMWGTGNRILRDSAAGDSVNWESRALVNSGGGTSIDWENKILSSPSYVALEYSSDETTNSQLYNTQIIPGTVQNTVTDNITTIGQQISASVAPAVSNYQWVYLDTDGIWKNSKNVAPNSTKMLGIYTNGYVLLEGDVAVNDNNAGHGIYVINADHGLPVYLSTTSGVLTTTIPPSDVVRVVGHIYYQSTTNANWWLMKFKPSNDWYQI
jgi:hypothetical protein